MLSYRHGALTVVAEASPRDEIVRALRQLDDRLFLEKQITLANEEVWCVVCNIGGDQPPVTILEWRDDRNKPIPFLASGLVNRVAQMDRDPGRLKTRVMEQNERLINNARKAADHAYDEIALDARRMSAGHSALLPRGQYLRRHRDRMRAQGRKV